MPNPSLSPSPEQSTEVTNVSLRPGAEWSRSEFPHPQVTLDFAADGELIAVEVLSPASRPADA